MYGVGEHPGKISVGAEVLRVPEFGGGLEGAQIAHAVLVDDFADDAAVFRVGMHGRVDGERVAAAVVGRGPRARGERGGVRPNLDSG